MTLHKHWTDHTPASPAKPPAQPAAPAKVDGETDLMGYCRELIDLLGKSESENARLRFKLARLERDPKMTDFERMLAEASGISGPLKEGDVNNVRWRWARCTGCGVAAGSDELHTPGCENVRPPIGEPTRKNNQNCTFESFTTGVLSPGAQNPSDLSPLERKWLDRMKSASFNAQHPVRELNRSLASLASGTDVFPQDARPVCSIRQPAMRPLTEEDVARADAARANPIMQAVGDNDAGAAPGDEAALKLSEIAWLVCISTGMHDLPWDGRKPRFLAQAIEVPDYMSLSAPPEGFTVGHWRTRK